MRNLIFIAFIFIFSAASAQNTIRFSQLNFAQGINNPAVLAVDGKIMADMIFRNQWFGVEGAPTSVGLNLQYEIDQNMAVGFKATYDNIGIHQNTSMEGQYAYRVVIDYTRFFALGVGLGMNYMASEYASSQTGTPSDPAFMNNFYKVQFNGSFGIQYNAPRFYIGASIPQLFQSTDYLKRSTFKPTLWHYYVSTGFYLDAGERFTFNPHIQLKAAMNSPLAADLILRNTFAGRFSVVVGFRTEMSIIAGIDMLISPNIRAGYSFNYDVGPLAKLKGGSNELYLGLAFPYRSDRQDFSNRIYISNKGGHKSNYRKNSRRKYRNRGYKYGRDTRKARQFH